MESVELALIQTAYEPGKMENKLTALAGEAKRSGATHVVLPEFSLSPYFAAQQDADVQPESIEGGPSCRLFSELAQANRVFLVGSLYEAPSVSPITEGRGAENYDTAVLFAPDGALHGVCRKTHIPDDIGYYERDYFGPGDSDYPVHPAGGVSLSMPTCYDQWFPEAARLFALHGAELIVYPTAIGSEPSAPTCDSQPAWTTMIRSHAIANGLFTAAANRIGEELGIRFYGSSVICAPDGEILNQAARDTEGVILADLDPARLIEWRRLFPLLNRREPQTYGELSRCT
jgi:N-carbamoylputrescine amidase